MSEAAAVDTVAPAGSPAEVWRAAALAVPVHRRYGPDDPLSPFVAWLQTRHRIGGGPARQTAQKLRYLLKSCTADEVLTADPFELALRVPHVARRTGVGDALGVHGKPYRVATRRFQEWWGAGCP